MTIYPIGPLWESIPTGKRDTSHEAASCLNPAYINEQSKRIISVVIDLDGLTDEQGQDILGISGNSYRPMRVALVRKGMMYASDERRKTKSGRNAIVWRASR